MSRKAINTSYWYNVPYRNFSLALNVDFFSIITFYTLYHVLLLCSDLVKTLNSLIKLKTEYLSLSLIRIF